jgi:hypothetical protein
LKTVLVRYKTHDDKAAENEALIHAVFDELRDTAPAGIRYATFKLDDGSSFVHLAIIDTVDGSNPLSSLASFARFQEDIDERCVEGPTPASLVPIDAYGF